MKRRTFLQSLVTAGATALLADKSLFAGLPSGQELQEGFKSPSVIFHPRAWWHWMNGNVSAEGVTLDLEFMKEIGLGGFQLFQVGAGMPPGPIRYGDPEHLQLLKRAAEEADRLGLEFNMMNCPGWSNSGGPWITPELSMQQLTWSETTVQGGRLVDVVLPQPYMKQGFYRDAFVIAFPALPGETRPLAHLLRNVTSTAGPVDVGQLTSNDLTKGVEIYPVEAGQPAYLQLEFNEPYEARSIAVYLFRVPVPSGSNSPRVDAVWLEASNDGIRFQKVCNLPATFNVMSQLFGGQGLEVPSSSSFSNVRARYYRLVSSTPIRICALRLSAATYITDWPYKANFAHRNDFGTGRSRPLQPTGRIAPQSAIDPKSVMDLTQHMDSQGRLRWNAPSGDWSVLRFGHTTTGVVNHPAPDGGLGLECDKYRKAAYDFHFSRFFGQLFAAIQPLAAKGNAGAVIDSYEVGMQTWTEEFPQEFQARRGYDLRAYLPAMTGRIVGTGEISDRFLWDFRRTCADLMADNYYGRFSELCHQHGMKAYAEPYSGGPFEEIQAASRLDIPMGEFWAAQNDYGVAYSVKMASSAAHVFGKKVVGAESFTSDPQLGKWQQYPYALKALGDWMYTQGLNQIFLVEDYMQPHPTAKPGMNCSWGSMLSRTTTWFGQGENWLTYMSRCQYLLRQGLLVADLVYFTGVEVPVDTPVKPNELSPAPPSGYYYDVTNAEGILNRMKAENGRMVLPDGMSYRVLVLPEDTRLTLELLRKIRELVWDGAVVVGPKPSRGPGLSGYPESDKQLRLLADEVWGELNGTGITERAFGKGRVFWGEPLTIILKKLDIHPDFDFTSRSGDAAINFIHRRIGDSHLYFIANRRRRAEELVCTFRVQGKQPEFWNPDTGDTIPAPVFDFVQEGTRLPVRLEPAGSLFVVFRSPVKEPSCHAITRNGVTLIGTKPYPTAILGRYRQVTNNFTISVWVMPDVDDLGLPAADSPQASISSFGAASNYVVYPPSGTKNYGPGHSVCGLSVGRNGVIVLERSEGSPAPVLAVHMPLAGWTHLALVYQAGTPSLYVNGRLVRQGMPSRWIVHPGLGEAFQDDGVVYFHGEMSEPVLFPNALDPQRIQQLAASGLPDPAAPPPLELVGHQNPELLIWQNGRYAFHSPTGRTRLLHVSDIGRPVEISGPWRVSFPRDLGAPAEVTLEKLISLHRHPHPGVRYFSGTATYMNRLDISHKDRGKRLYLDLGRVQVIAEVRINGNSLGSLWKPPFRLDVTDVVSEGENNLEILVTNLWPNRLIGDEHLPPENDYSEPGGFFGGAIKKMPDWYIKGEPKPPGGRVTFTTWKHFNKDSPLLESGLLGPVLLRTAVLHPVGSLNPDSEVRMHR